MVVLNPNNWHWVDKNTLPWTVQYFNDNFQNFKYQDFIISSVIKVDGDSNVSQRKGKPICYFDLQLEFAVRCEKEDGDDEEGKIVVPEFMHDETDFEIKIDEFSGKKDQRNDFINEFRSKLLQYQNDLITEHSKDLQHDK
ncbi:hypothetical protein KAFR_0A08200 [Kazachstania africana CBS 2517]|uniref:Activator of Hsp90 ATPase AHSA1-like N-terminal domain-containing protein n=1 Tax=Kazachstania africana (strain ATCC 22294 / BCRC 22015 / CBS 2517 / CECT 1963 / NBRC 1671 / NRRL Y-8276) TaxID=1071382 RepID=H2APF4_KAZAF|nr:hypothetical protein KAFR_0A08200 [Kazachstania africana CBS 2517]CCF56254.1 hypothetical protein KAFR_0A08200 [Kazachstania africana CBS 2517]